MLKWLIWLFTGADCDYPRRQLVLDLTPEMVISVNAEPTAEHWRRGNKIFDHIKGCRCSTCGLVANMALQMDARKEQKS